MTIAALPALDRTSATFKTELDALFLTALPAFSVQAEAARVAINASTATAEAARVTAQSAIDAGLANAAANATTATTKASESNASAIAAAASAASIAGGPVSSINGVTGAVTVKTVNGVSLIGAGDVAVGGGIANVSTATTSTTLTSTSTMLAITPSAYGVTVKLPDATTCALGGPLHIIDNRGAYPVRVTNNSNVLLGFVGAGNTSDASLEGKSTAAGVWNVGNSDRVGGSAQITTSSLSSITFSIDIGSGKEMLFGVNASSYPCAVVYDSLTNTFGSITVIRSAAAHYTAYATSANAVLVCSALTTALQAVVLTVSGTTITVNTAATATLPNDIFNFGAGQAGSSGPSDGGIVAVGSSFVVMTGFNASSANQIRAMTISGTTVAIGTPAALTGTVTTAYMLGIGGVLVAASTTYAVGVYYQAFSVSGTALAGGTVLSVLGPNCEVYTLLALGSRVVTTYNQSLTTTAPKVAILTISGTTLTASTVTMGSTTYAGVSSIQIIGSNKALICLNKTSSNLYLLTDTAGVASVGTALSLIAGATFNYILYANGTTAYVQSNSGGTNTYLQGFDCSAATPVLLGTQRVADGLTQGYSAGALANGSMSPSAVRGANFYQTSLAQLTPATCAMRVFNGVASTFPSPSPKSIQLAFKGKADSEVWGYTSSLGLPTTYTKLECVA